MSNVHRSCVSSEDIKIETGSDKIFSYQQGGVGPYLMKNNKEIGYLEEYLNILGHDFIIKYIKIYGNDALSKTLTGKYLGKILIPSIHVDAFD